MCSIVFAHTPPKSTKNSKPFGRFILTLREYKHIDNKLSILHPLLKDATSNASGTNIMVYGSPGVGKTELAKTLAKELDAELFEISYLDNDDNPLSGTERLKAFRLAQAIFSDKKCNADA